MDRPCKIHGGPKSSNGYGVVTLGPRRKTYAHRFVYGREVGPIPSGYVIDHLCHNEDLRCQASVACIHRLCIEPTHLEAVTRAENNRRARTPAALEARWTHCKRGHELTPENCYTRPDGHSWRVCRICARDRKRARGGHVPVPGKTLMDGAAFVITANVSIQAVAFSFDQARNFMLIHHKVDLAVAGTDRWIADPPVPGLTIEVVRTVTAGSCPCGLVEAVSA